MKPAPPVISAFWAPRKPNDEYPTALSEPFHRGWPGLPRVPATSSLTRFGGRGCVVPLGYTYAFLRPILDYGSQ